MGVKLGRRFARHEIESAHARWPAVGKEGKNIEMQEWLADSQMTLR